MIDDPGIERVELFVGEHCPGDCPSRIAPPDLPMMLVTNTYVVTDSVPWSVTKRDFDSGVAGFRLESSDDTTVAILVAVGYDAQEQIRWSSTFHDVFVPSDDAVYWRVKLAPTTPISPPPVSPQPAGTERIKHWQQPSKRLPACLLLEHWNGDNQPTRDLVVPDEDHDCDELPEDDECAPWTPNAVGVPPTLEDASCVLMERIGNDPASNVCMIGGPECTEDREAPRASCVRLVDPYCVPTSLCQCTEANDFAQCVHEIVLDELEREEMPAVACTFQLDEEGRPCSHEPIVLDLAPFLMASPTRCSAIRLNEWRPPLEPFTTKLHIDATSKLEIKHFDKPCKGELVLDGEVKTDDLLAALELDLDNDNHIVVPAKLEFRRTGCSTPSDCEVLLPDKSDAIWQCVAPTAMSCLPEPNSTCKGPMCNGVCCGEGETCTPDGCSCGGGDPCTEPGDACQAAITPPSGCGTLCCGITTPCPF